jgi:hypothetical protein
LLAQDCASGLCVLSADHDLPGAAEGHAVSRSGAAIGESVQAADTCSPQQATEHFGLRLACYDFDDN